MRWKIFLKASLRYWLVFLAVISLRLPLYVETIAFVIALPFAFSLVEPARQAINKHHPMRVR